MALGGREPDQSELDTLDALASDYLSTCFPVDHARTDFSGYESVAEALTLDGLDRATEVRGRVVRGLTLGEFSGSDAVARDQLLEWVSAENDLMESGEKYRQLTHKEGPYHRLALAAAASLAANPADWDGILLTLQTAAQGLRSHRELLQRGRDMGIVVSQREAILARQRCMGVSLSPGLVDTASRSSVGGISLAQEEALLAAVSEMSSAADEMATFLEHEYLPHTSTQPVYDRDRYELWVRKLVGEDLDLDQFYASVLDEIRQTQSRLEAAAAGLSPGRSARDLGWEFDSSSGGEIETTNDLREWLLRSASKSAETTERLLVRLPDGSDQVEMLDGGEGLASVVEVLPPARDGSRGGILLRQSVYSRLISTWSLMPRLHMYLFPGEHLYNCFLNDPRSDLRDFQRALVNHTAISGWTDYAMMCAAFETGEDDPQLKFNTLRVHMGTLVFALGDVGIHLGLPIPEEYSELVGDHWTEEGFAQMIAHLGSIPREYATGRVAECVANPGHALGPIVGSRVRADALQRSRKAGGDSFDLRDYHDRVLRLAPTGMRGLRSQLDLVTIAAG